LSRKGSETAADVSEMAANIAMTVMGFMIFFFCLFMFSAHGSIVFSRLISVFSLIFITNSWNLCWRGTPFSVGFE
jgi:uncharacterized membrane protein